MKYIGIDIGSSFIKTVVIDTESSEAVCSEKQPSPGRRSCSDPLVFEIPAERCVSAVRDLLGKYARIYDGIAGVILSTQMHGFVYCVPGEPDVYVSWQDMLSTERLPGADRSFLEELGELRLLEQIRGTINAIPDAERADSDLYHERLSVCRSCEHLFEAMCVKCGCYVEVRAAYRDKYCPLMESRW